MPEQLRFTFEVDGEVQVDRALSRFGEYAKDLSVPFKKMAESFKRLERAQFGSEGGRAGQWAPLSATYAAWKAANFPGKPLLQLTGILSESLQGDNPWYIERITPKSLELGTRVSYARFHQRGTGKMPMRSVIKLTEADKQEWMKILHNFVWDAARKANLYEGRS